MSSHADQHDLDKLGRWHRELAKGPSGSFPVYAIFLVTANDRVAHDIFRKFRSSFEARNAAFENLVIFGQHGVSTTAQRMLVEFGLSQGSLPILALIALADPSIVYTLALPSGADGAVPNEGPVGEEWQKALNAVEAATVEANRPLGLDAFHGVAQRRLDHGPLDVLVGGLIRELT
jgi:hypothetical protein